MKISELIEQLKAVLEKEGDLPVYSRADYDWVTEVEVGLRESQFADEDVKTVILA